MLANKYLINYPSHIVSHVQQLIDSEQLASFLYERHPSIHNVTTDHALRDYVTSLKSQYMKKSAPLSKVIYDGKIHVLHNALGLHTYVSRVQGSQLKRKNEIRIGAVFKKTSEALLRMIVVHELAHIKEREHNKAFYRLCLHMLPEYHQLEFEMRLHLILWEWESAR
jgi:predicted metal-dependent hydrolase